jgi:type IV pilus assembly protein PilQ
MNKGIIKYLILLILYPALLYGNSVDLSKKISLQFERVSISTILTMLAQRNNLNIVQSSELTEEVSLQLDNVTLGDALDALLSSNGYNYYFTGDIIVVKPIELNAPGELISKAVSLNYISPAAAVNVIENVLSTKGKVKVVENPTETAGQKTKTARPTQIIVVDFPNNIEKIQALINEIDLPQQQLAIKVRMIETNIDNEKNIGISWPTSLSARLHGIVSSSDTSGSSISGTNAEALGQMQLPDGAWEWGRLSVNETNVILNFLDQNGNSKLISDPHITTLNNHEAEIKVTTIVPIQTINRFSEGGSVQDIVTFQDEEIGITLRVTPHICDNDNIILDVYPSVAEIIGYSGPIDNQKPITSQRSVSAKITVRNNETAAIGGLMKENKIESVQKIFFLGSIPIIGNLFKHKAVESSNTELLILITPTILTK